VGKRRFRRTLSTPARARASGELKRRSRGEDGKEREEKRPDEEERLTAKKRRSDEVGSPTEKGQRLAGVQSNYYAADCHSNALVVMQTELEEKAIV